VDAHDIEIIASDIDTNVLEAARAGIFGRRALMRLSAQLTDKYFTPAGPELWQIIDGLRQSVRFTAINIVEPTETLRYGPFDVIFCRNPLIYFDDVSRGVAAENLYESLAPGGYICLGHAESMSRISSCSKCVGSRTPSFIAGRRRRCMGGRKLRVLIVDHANLVRIYCRQILEEAGFEVEEASSNAPSDACRGDFRKPPTRDHRPSKRRRRYIPFQTAHRTGAQGFSRRRHAADPGRP
jgi:hypothetical protein